MSLSSVDHYGVWKAKQRLQYAENELEQQGDFVNSRRHLIAELQSRLEVVQQELVTAEMEYDEQEGNVSNSREELEVANAVAENHVVSPKNEPVVDPTTGLKQGEKIPLLQEQVEWVETIGKARDAMEAGDLDQARILERKATKMCHAFDYVVNARAVGIPSAFQVSAADFVAPFSLASEEELQKTLEYAKEHATETTSIHSLMQNFIWEHISGGVSKGYPEFVNKYLMEEITSQRLALEKEHEKQQRDQDEEMEEEEEEEEEEDEQEEQNGFEMHEEAWEAIEKASRNRIAHSETLNAAQLELPRSNSAPIARYNPTGHFAFKSEDANASIDDLVDALCCCTLRSRPLEMCDGISDDRVRRPIGISIGDMKCLDIDGNLMAFCGDLYPDSFMDNHTYVGCRPVPRNPVNWDAAKSMLSWKDSEGNDCFPDTKFVFEDGDGRRRKLWVSGVVADDDSKRIWASSRNGFIRAFTTEEGVERRNRTVAMLQFDEMEVEAQSKYVNPHYSIAKCGDCIVGAGNTGRLSVWNMQTAAEEYSSSHQGIAAKAEDSSDSDEDSETGMELDSESTNKRQKVEPYPGMAPKFLQVEQEGFCCGDLQFLGGSNHMLIAPLRADCGSKDSPVSNSLRLFDLTAESVVGLFIGNQQDVSIEKQYCVDSHNVVFSTDGGTGFVWDIRTFRPTFALHTGKRKGQILGVPASSPVAFTFNDGSESISCWDLRMPASHAYTMATGNCHVTSMLWHEDTSSLLATTRSDHMLTVGRYGRQYLYGEPLEFDDENDNEDIRSAWPSRAKHEPTYFGGTPWHLDCCPAPRLLQYAFETRRNTE